jgi:hypothetical protein
LISRRIGVTKRLAKLSPNHTADRSAISAIRRVAGRRDRVPDHRCRAAQRADRLRDDVRADRADALGLPERHLGVVVARRDLVGGVDQPADRRHEAVGLAVEFPGVSRAAATEFLTIDAGRRSVQIAFATMLVVARRDLVGGVDQPADRRHEAVGEVEPEPHRRQTEFLTIDAGRRSVQIAFATMFALIALIALLSAVCG